MMGSGQMNKLEVEKMNILDYSMGEYLEGVMVQFPFSTIKQKKSYF